MFFISANIPQSMHAGQASWHTPRNSFSREAHEAVTRNTAPGAPIIYSIVKSQAARAAKQKRT